MFGRRTVFQNRVTYSEFQKQQLAAAQSAQMGKPSDGKPSGKPSMCKFFLRGNCTKAECPFSHEQQGQKVSPQNRICKYGLVRTKTDCPRKHIDPLTGEDVPDVNVRREHFHSARTASVMTPRISSWADDVEEEEEEAKRL